MDAAATITQTSRVIVKVAVIAKRRYRRMFLLLRLRPILVTTDMHRNDGSRGLADAALLGVPRSPGR